ncbi:MAG: hypothetical protein U0133_21040 [Gemmatimonadales bacterium]
MADRAVVSEELADALEQVIRRTGQQPRLAPAARGTQPGRPLLERPDRDDLVEAYHEVLADGVKPRLPAAPSAPARRWPWIAGAVLLLAAGAVWIRQSNAIARAAAPIVVTPEERKQELELVTVANRIARYLQEEGSLPSVLAAAGIELPGMTYEVRGPRAFLLASERQGRSLRVTVQAPERGPLVFAFVRPKP